MKKNIVLYIALTFNSLPNSKPDFLKNQSITSFVEQLGRLNELREFWTSLMKRTLMGMKFVTL